MNFLCQLSNTLINCCSQLSVVVQMSFSTNGPAGPHSSPPACLPSSPCSLKEAGAIKALRRLFEEGTHTQGPPHRSELQHSRAWSPFLKFILTAMANITVRKCNAHKLLLIKMNMIKNQKYSWALVSFDTVRKTQCTQITTENNEYDSNQWKYTRDLVSLDTDLTDENATMQGWAISPAHK